MKIIACGLLFVAASAFADPFSGAYMGAGIQSLTLKTRSDYNYSSSISGFPVTAHDGLAGNFLLGYGQRLLNRFFLGMELGYVTDSRTVTSVTSISPDTANKQVYMHLSKQFNMGLKLGGFITSNTLLYLHPAIANASINTDLLSGSMQSVSKRSIWGGMIGAGIAHAFTNHFIGQVEADYTAYNSVTVGALQLSGVGIHHRPCTYSIGATAIYKF
jgi:hypothetical protein